MQKKTRGRPKKEINKKEFENLCAIQCTKPEICAVLEVTDKTLDRWVHENYFDENGNPLKFCEVFQQKRGKGKVSVRRSQFLMAQKNPTMSIWWGKQYMGQSDNASVDLAVEVREDDPLTKALKEEAEKMKNNAD